MELKIEWFVQMNECGPIREPWGTLRCTSILRVIKYNILNSSSYVYLENF